MYTWPVPNWNAKFSYHDRPRCYGAPRDDGKRKHAGCDLYAPEGTPVVAVWHGRVRQVYEFYGKADAIEIDHGVLGIIRYGELVSADELQPGQIIKGGDQIGKVAQLVGMGNIHPMLHFELYSGKGTGRLTCTGNAFRRRSDLLDPTRFLDSIRLANYGALRNVA
jgi:murein DD-endopeptidase MepM/ murein hydrolase activator NlpD